MNIKITATNLDIGDALRSYTHDIIEKKIKKYFDHISKIDIFYSKHKNNFHVKIAISELPTNRGLVVKSDGNSSDPRMALEESIEKSIKQLLRYKKKISNFRKRNKGYEYISNPNLSNDELNILFQDFSKEGNFETSKYILQPNPLTEEIEEKLSKESNISNNENINIVEEKNTMIEELSLDDAIMKMDLADLPALVFINKDNKRLNFVYYRKDGRLSFIDPKEYHDEAQ